MSGDPIPHAEICAAQDRSWTERLLARFVAPDLGPDERDEIASTLERLADLRAEAPLTVLLADRAKPEALRSAAGRILRACDAVERSSLPALLRDGDLVEQRHAVLAMDHGEAELVAAIAADPVHPLHREAIVAMEWGFQAPRFQALKIAALAHADPTVREAAADVLLWDEPVAAEEPLLRAAEDPVDAVAIAALKTLAYYPSRRVLLRLAELRAVPGKRGEAAGDAIDELRGSFEHAACEPFTIPAPVRHPIEAEALMRDLADLGGAWEEKVRRLRDADPSSVGPAERAQLVPFFVEHPDPLVRGECVHLLAAWGEHEALIRLIGDRRFLVMKHAMYALGKALPSDAAARCAREHLDHPRVTSTHAYETLETYVAHAPAAEAIPLLARLAAEDARESIRSDAVYALMRLRATREIEGLLPLLEAPPQVTWSVHVALLEACWKLGLDGSRGVEALRDVDNADVQGALALAP